MGARLYDDTTRQSCNGAGTTPPFVLLETTCRWNEDSDAYGDPSWLADGDWELDTTVSQQYDS